MSAIQYTQLTRLELTMQQVMGSLEELSLEAAYSPTQSHCFEILSIEPALDSMQLPGEFRASERTHHL